MDVLTQTEALLSRWPDLVERFLFAFGLSVRQPGLFWSLSQIALILLALLVAVFVGRIAEPRLEAFIRNAGLRAATLRIAAVLLRRVRGMLFSLLLWFEVAAMRAATWKSNSYFITLVASLVTAWVIITIASRIIRNRTIARIIGVGGWILVTLGLLGILPEAAGLLDSLAIAFGEIRISALTVLQGVVVISVLFWLAGLLSRLLETQLAVLEDFSPTQRVLIGKIARFALVAMAFVIGLYAVGVDFTALTFVSGAIGLGLGFGLQKVVSNLVSGIILLLDKSIKPGDVISVGDTFGWITALNARYASVTMRDGREILIPNEDLITQQVQNWSFQDPYVRLDIHFGVSYESDPHEVRELAKAAATGHKRVIKDHDSYKTVCHITGFGDSSIDFILRFWVSDPQNGLTNVRGDIFLALWDTFKAHGVGIPFPHRELIFRGGEMPGTAGDKPPSD